jgi:hypothetical protein
MSANGTDLSFCIISQHFVLGFYFHCVQAGTDISFRFNFPSPAAAGYRATFTCACGTDAPR